MNSFQDRNGGVTTYAFSFPSIAVTDIKVTVDDVEQTYLTHYQVDSYSTTSGGTVNFQVGGAAATYKNAAGATVTGTPPATQPLNIRVYRQTKLINTSTGLAAPEADFTPGSSIRAADLDNNQSQVIYATQEERDQTITGPDIKDGVITNAKISNVAEVEVSKLKDGTARQILQTDSAGTGVEWTSNVDIPGTLDVTGLTHFDDDINLINDKKILLGTSDNFSIYWKNSSLDAIINSDNDIIYKTGSIHKFEKDGNSLLSLDSTTADFKVHVRPWNNNTWDLGTNSYQWRDLYLDGTGYIDTVNVESITGSAIVTSGTSTSDNKVYSAKRCDELYYNIGTAEEIQSGETWTAADTKIATTAAIDARIIDLVDDVGGFVPIANETSFPNANPDVNNDAGTLVSVPLANTLTSNAGGFIYINNGTLDNSQVTIVGAGVDKTYTTGFGIIVETTSTLHRYTFHRYVPKATEVTTVATNISNINAAVANETNINAAVNNATNINTVATNISDITKVADIDSDVTAVAGDAADIGTCSTNIGSIAAIGADLNNNYANIVDYGSITANATSTSGTSYISTLASGSNLTNIATVGGISSDVTAVAGISTNVTDVANNATNITTCATNISAITGASTQATNAANSATSAASSATTATTQATNASASATSAASSATTATAQATTATTQATNAAASATLANTYQTTAKQWRDDAAGIKTQAESNVYNLAAINGAHTAWGDITDVGTTHFSSETTNILLTMSKGSTTYDYGNLS